MIFEGSESVHNKRDLARKASDTHLSLVPVWGIEDPAGPVRLHAVPVGHAIGSALALLPQFGVPIENRIATLLSNKTGRNTFHGLDPEIYRALVFSGRSYNHYKTAGGLCGNFSQLQPLMELTLYSQPS